MELRQLRYFVEIAEQLHFSNAAKRLFVSQSALSQQIQLLENEIGVELFERSQRTIARRVALTEAGAEFLVNAKKILALSQKAIEQARKTGLQEKVVRLGVYKITLRERVVEMIGFIATQFPEIAIKLVELPTSANVQSALLEETIDLGFIIPPLKYPELSEKPFKKGHLCVMLHKNHPLAAAKVLPLEALQNEKWVELSQSIHPLFDELEQRCQQAGFSRKAQIVQEVSSLELLSSLVSVGIGVAFVPSLFDLSRESNIVVIKVVQTLDEPNSEIEINNAIAYKTGKNSPLIQALIEVMDRFF